MESKKDIGKAFREKLDQLHKQPGDAVWDSIRGDLDKGRNKAVPAWLRFWLISGVFVLTAFFTYPLWENKVPHIYIEMPKEDKEQVTDITREGNNASDTYNTGTANTENENDKPGVNPTNTGAATDTGSKALNNTSGTVIGDGNGINSPTVAGNGQRATIVAKETTKGRVENDKSAKTDIRSKTTVAGTDKGKSSASARTAGAIATDSRDISKSPEVASVSSSGKRFNGKNKQTRTTGDRPGVKTSTGKEIADTGKTEKTIRSVNNEDDETDTGFIVPASADYKNYRNNTGNGFVISDFEKDSLEHDSIKITDKLQIRTTGVEQVIKAPETKKETASDKNFYAYAFAAPMKYTFNDNGSYLDSSARSYSTSSKTKLAYGASLGLRTSEKLSVRAGIILSGAEVETNNVAIQNTYTGEGEDLVTISPNQFENVQYENGISNNLIRQQLATGSDEMDEDMAIVNVRTELSFVEVPFEVTYNLMDAGQFGIALKGMFGARFLNENKVFAENAQGSMVMGKLQNIDDVSYSAGIGASLFYKLLPDLQINVEPGFKYFSGNKDAIKPVAYMLQAGLQYNFDLFRKK